jgi:anti-sigma-K factor RskA
MSDAWNRLTELAALRASGAANQEELRELEQLLKTHPSGLAEMRASDDAATRMATSLPPVEPRRDTLERIRTTVRGAKVVSLEERRMRRAVAVAGVSVVAVAAMAFMMVRAQDQIRDLEEDVSVANAELEVQLNAMREQVQKLVKEKEALIARYAPVRDQNVTMARMEKEGKSATMFLDRDDGKGLVFVQNMTPPENKDFQLWFVPPEGKPVSAGVLEVGPDGMLSATPEVPKDMGKWRPAISLEPKGGSPQPTEVMMVGEML